MRSAPRPRISATASQGCGRWRQRRGVSRAALRRADAPASRPTCGSWICSTRSRSSPSRSGTISTSWSATRASQNGRAILAQHRADLRRGREGLRRRPLYHRGDLGRRIQLRHADRRPPGDPLDRDARLHRPPAGLFPRGVPRRRWKSSRAATCGRSSSRARGRARSGRPSSCRPRSSASPSISTATAGATSSTRCPISIASTANNLKKDGWVAGQTWGYEVVVPQGFNFMLADRSRVLTMREWERAGIRRAGGKPFPRAGRPRLSAGAGGRAGAGLPDAAEFPRDHEIQSGRGLCAGDRPSRRPAARRRAVRAALAAARARAHAARSASSCSSSWRSSGFDVGEPDGRLGAKTRTALRDFQAAVGAVPDGFASASILDRLRGR